ncbi:MAG: hypothetical protein LUM44_10250 [Pyrinomonadaceae bacterium]|nr:hypothetical protein [Pyrinomonadaceae bacterium]
MNEAGHAKNVANYASYVSIIPTYGTVYKPSQAMIEHTALAAKLPVFETAKNSVIPKASAETLAINARQAVFDPLKTLVTRIVSAAEVSVNDALFAGDIRTVARKLQGRRASGKAVDDPLTPDIDESEQSISASQMSFDNRIEHFEELIGLLTASGSYNVNEDDLKISALEALLADMKAKNTAAVNAINEARAARIARDQILYNDTDGIIALTTLVKKYVKSLFGAQSPQYKQLVAIKFKKP